MNARLGDGQLRKNAFGSIAHAAGEGRPLQKNAHVAVGAMGLVRLHVHVECRSHDTVMNPASEVQMVSIKAESGDRVANNAHRDAQIDEGSDDHIPCNSPHGIEKQREPGPCPAKHRRDGRKGPKRCAIRGRGKVVKMVGRVLSPVGMPVGRPVRMAVRLVVPVGMPVGIVVGMPVGMVVCAHGPSLARFARPRSDHAKHGARHPIARRRAARFHPRHILPPQQLFGNPLDFPRRQETYQAVRQRHLGGLMRFILVSLVVATSAFVTGCGSTVEATNPNVAAADGGTANGAVDSGAPAPTGRKGDAQKVLDGFTCPTGAGALVDGMNTNFTAGGQKRAFRLALPKNAGTKPVAVVFAWHGVGDSVDNFRGYFGPDPDGRSDFPIAVVTPSCVGCRETGNDPGLLPTSTPMGITWDIFESKPGDGNLEAALFEGVLGCLKAQITIDAAHVHAIGFSGGAIATGMLHARYPALIHSVVQLSGAWFNNTETVDAVKANLNAAAPAAANFGVDLTAIKLEWNPLSAANRGAVLASHGGARDQYAVAGVKVIDFELSAGFARPFLKAQSRNVVDCPHTSGHTPPRYIQEKNILDFIQDNPLPETATAVKMPASLGSNCTVSQ